LAHEELIRTLKGSLLKIENHPLFRSRLPAHWGVLIDPDWSRSGGLWSDTLQTPQGDPAVLFNPDTLASSRFGYSSVVHELTHLVHHRYRPREENWVREGVALLAEYVVTQHFYVALRSGFTEPESSLVASTDPTNQDSVYGDERGNQYGHLTQFFYYIYRVCGGDGLFDTLLTDSSDKTGIDFVDYALAKTRASDADVAAEPACAGFEPLFRAFETARFVADSSSASGYVLSGAGYSAAVRDKRREIPPYSATAYKLASGKKCAKGDRAWGRDRCIRIKLD
jgi:hypothetical protein